MQWPRQPRSTLRPHRAAAGPPPSLRVPMRDDLAAGGTEEVNARCRTRPARLGNGRRHVAVHDDEVVLAMTCRTSLLKSAGSFTRHASGVCRTPASRSDMRPAAVRVRRSTRIVDRAGPRPVDARGPTRLPGWPSRVRARGPSSVAKAGESWRARSWRSQRRGSRYPVHSVAGRRDPRLGRTDAGSNFAACASASTGDPWRAARPALV